MEAMCRELSRLSQGFEDAKGTGTFFFLDLDQIARIPKGKVVTYARVVVDYREHKKEKERMRLTVGGNLIE